jgi:iron complex transport system substrate-binding protein
MPIARLRLTALAILFAAAWVPALAQVSVRDDLGRMLLMKQPAQRIVTLAPFLTELVYSAGAGERLVGVGSFSDYPPEAKKLPEVATGAGFSLEQLAKLKPDLVIAWRDGFRKDDIERISGYGATVFVAQARRLEDIPRLLIAIGAMTGRNTEAVSVDFTTRIEKLRRANINKPRVRVFLEIWHRPLTTISGNHFMNEGLEICRGENVFQDLEGVSPKVDWEDIFAKEPYAIVGAGSAASLDEFRGNWTIRTGLQAVKENRLIYLEGDAFLRPSLRIVEGIAQLCDALDKLRPAPRTAPQRTQRPSQYGM